MEKENDIVKIFSGSEITASLIKAELEALGIPALIKNDFQTGISAGFVGGIPSLNDLYVNESDKQKAELLVKDFTKEGK